MVIGPEPNAVALFVRNPVPGHVKTRLARDIGHENACTLYQAMVKDILSAITSINIPVYLFHDGVTSNGLPREWIDASHCVVAQQGDSLGERMATAFHLLFSNNVKRVALLGSDIPGMDSKILKAAFRTLESRDAAIAPAVDGGYCLIAVNDTSYRDRFFQDIEWSTDRVLHCTLERFAECGLRVHLLESRQDIDTYDDLTAYCLNPSNAARQTNEWLSAAGYLPAQEQRINDNRQAKQSRCLNTRGKNSARHLQGM